MDRGSDRSSHPTSQPTGVEFKHDILQDPEIPASEAAWQSRLLGLGFLTEAGESICCTIAGLVLFGKRPRRYLKQAGLRVFAFNDQDKVYRAELDEILDGPMVGRWDVTGSSKELVDGGLIERFVDAIGPFISRQAGTVDAGFRRETEWFYPVEAVRETVLNAQAHRDWTRFVEIEVGSYADRLEVISPGALPNAMSVEKMMAGQRSPRIPGHGGSSQNDLVSQIAGREFVSSAWAHPTGGQVAGAAPEQATL